MVLLPRRVLNVRAATLCRRLYSSAASSIAELDHVLLRPLSAARAPILTKPITHGSNTKTRYGRVSNDDLVGLRDRDLVKTKTGTELRVHIPTLEEFIELTPRKVTPIYPTYASLITSLLDFNLTAPRTTSTDGPSFSILEAGTGHGGLTLHLARALQAGNSPLPPAVLEEIHNLRMHYVETAKASGAAPIDNPNSASEDAEKQETPPPAMPALSAYKSQRSAILHTLDISPQHSTHAQHLIRAFRRGIYYPSIDFHTGDLSSFLASSTHSAPFSHIILDLPSPEASLAQASEALETAGSLLVFQPSVTQLGQCLRKIRREGLPLALERVLEVGTGMAGGREWDLREVKPRRRGREVAKEAGGQVEDGTGEDGGLMDTVEGESGGAESDVVQSDLVSEQATEYVAPTASGGEGDGFELVCRPKVGLRIVGGGFIGVWKKMRFRDRNEEGKNGTEAEGLGDNKL